MATVEAKEKQVVPHRIVIRHLSGSKANQVDEFPLDHFKEITIGRTATSNIKFDPDKDDLVSREHARIVPDEKDPSRFTVRDLDSRNGTFVNKQKIMGLAQIVPTDVIQLGPGGPEFEFDLEPRPDTLMRKTRIADGAAAPERGTRASDVVVAVPVAEAAPALPADTHRPVGKATVERMLTQTKSQSRNYVLFGGALVVLLVIVLVGLFNKRIVDLFTKQVDTLGDKVEEAERNRPLTPQQIGATYADATVFFEVGWKLIDAESGQQIFHLYIPQKDKDGKPATDQQGQPVILAAYIQLDDGSIEPVLGLDDAFPNKPIGGRHTGSGFVVSNDGFILTNRHVAASWFTIYSFPQDAFPGILFAKGQDGQYQPTSLIQQGQMPRWVPAESKMFGQKPISGKILEGRNDYLDVTFAKNELRIPAQLVRTSNRHDVAMVKINVPQSLNKVELNDNYDTVEMGNAVTVLGYPGLSPMVGVVTKSQDVFNRKNSFIQVPDPTLTSGIVSRVIRGEMAPTGRTVNDYYSFFGDTYQLDINATGAGNSGGPVFDDRGRVVGIYTAGKWGPGEAISFATPIRFGMELMGTQPVLR